MITKYVAFNRTGIMQYIIQIYLYIYLCTILDIKLVPVDDDREREMNFVVVSQPMESRMRAENLHGYYKNTLTMYNNVDI